MNVFSAAGLLLLCAVAVSTAEAASVPDAGQLLREQQPQRQLPMQLPKPEAEAERTPLVDSGIRVAVKGFRFSGYEGLATDTELRAITDSAIGKSLTFSELQGVAANITAWLKGKGWFLARAYLPRQDVTSGIIEIAIIQGKSDGNLNIRRDASARIREKTLRAMAEAAVRPGQALNEQELERITLLINDLPGVSARTSVRPGTVAGSSDILIDISEGPLLQGTVWSDNSGNRYTGEWRGNGMLNINDPLRYGDQLSVMFTGAEGLNQGRLGYTFPVGYRGLKGSVAYTGMNYEIGKELASLKSTGQAHTLETNLTYPIIRRRTANLNASIGYSYKRLTDELAGGTIRDKELNIGSIGISGDHYDTFLGGGYSSAGFTLLTGDLNLAGVPDDLAADQATARANGRYARFNLNLARLQRITENTNLSVSYSGQFAAGNLDSSEKFNLGGPNGVRAFPVGEASGDEGHLFTVELRRSLPFPEKWGSLQLSGFFDAGHITQHKDEWLNSVATATAENGYWLAGGGVGLALGKASLYSLRMQYAHRATDNPGRSTTGNDADGRNDSGRFWLQGMLYF